MTRQEVLGEITACKQLLADSDYSILKSLEGLLTCTSATGMISYLKDLTSEMLALKVQRQEWRDKINILEKQLEEAADEENVETVEPAETAEVVESAEAAEAAEAAEVVESAEPAETAEAAEVVEPAE